MQPASEMENAGRPAFGLLNRVTMALTDRRCAPASADGARSSARAFIDSFFQVQKIEGARP
jgi:hypothetical protein